MSIVLERYKKKVTDVFSLGVEVPDVARSLKTISLDLKLLAVNGIVQAARIGDHQGQSLITLSGFLSDLPLQIAPELEQLESLANKLSTEITIASISVRKFMIYSLSLSSFVKNILERSGSRYSDSDINLMNSRELLSIARNPLFRNATDQEKKNLEYLAGKNLKIIVKLSDLLAKADSTINSSRLKIEKIRRNGFIANYMGSNILIESAYLTKKDQNFSDLVNNIRQIVKSLNQKLDSILDKINESSKILKNLINSGIIK